MTRHILTTLQEGREPAAGLCGSHRPGGLNTASRVEDEVGANEKEGWLGPNNTIKL